MYPAPGLASLPSPSTLFLSSSESSGPEDPAWSESVQQINKTTGLLGRLLDPATTTSGITSTPPPPLAASSPSTATTPSPVRIHLASPAPVIPLFPGVTTPSSAPLFAPHVRVRNPAENDEATFFDVFAPEVDTPSPIRLTRRLTFPSLPTLPVTSMSMTWNMPHVVLEEEEDLASSFSPSRRASDFGPGRRPLGSPIALLRGRNLSDLSLAEVSSAQQQHAHPPASFLEPGRPASIVSCHTFGHHSSQNSASLQVLYDRSPSPAVSGCVTPVGGGNNLAPDAASSFMSHAPAGGHRDSFAFSYGDQQQNQQAAEASLLHALNSYMIRSPQDSPACGGERPRRRRGSQSNSKLQARLGGGGPRRPVPPVPAMRRSLPLLQPTTTRSPADSERSAYADVSDYDDGFSPRATTTTLSPPGEPIRLANGRINPRRRYSHEPLQVLTTTASCNEAAGAGATGLVVMAVNLTRADSSSSRAGERRLASSAMMVQPVPKRNASMAELGPRASGGGGGPVIPSRSSSSSLVVVARAAALSSSSLEQQLSRRRRSSGHWLGLRRSTAHGCLESADPANLGERLDACGPSGGRLPPAAPALGCCGTTEGLRRAHSHAAAHWRDGPRVLPACQGHRQQRDARRARLEFLPLAPLGHDGLVHRGGGRGGEQPAEQEEDPPRSQDAAPAQGPFLDPLSGAGVFTRTRRRSSRTALVSADEHRGATMCSRPASVELGPFAPPSPGSHQNFWLWGGGGVVGQRKDPSFASLRYTKARDVWAAQQQHQRAGARGTPSLEEREREREREAIMPIAIISRANSLVLDREEAEMREGLGRVGWDGEAKDEVGGWRKSVGDGREDGDGDGESRVQTRTGPRPKGMVSMQDALAMGPQLVLVRDPVDSAAAAAAAERERSGVSSTMGEIRKGWMGVPAALRSVRSLASFTSAVGGGGAKTTPRRPHFAASSKPAPLLTPPEETTKPQLRPAINYNMMLGVAGALLAASGPRQRSRSTSAPLGARSGLADEVKGGAKQAVTPAVFVPHAHELQGILLNRSVAQLPATPPREPNVAATTTAKEGGQTAEPFLGLGPAFSTPSPATASAAGVVRDIAWAGRPDLITDQHSLTSHGGRGSGSGSNGLPALSETPEGLRRAFWNEDDERGEQSRFRRIPPRSQSSLGLLQQPRSGEDHSTPSPSLARRRSIGTPPRTASTMATLSSTQRFERDQYAWLRMQEASPTLPSCDLPRRGKETVSTIPFPRASPINIKHGGGGQLPAVMRGSPGRASRQSVTDAASALVYSLQRASSSGSGSSRSGSLPPSMMAKAGRLGEALDIVGGRRGDTSPHVSSPYQYPAWIHRYQQYQYTASTSHHQEFLQDASLTDDGGGAAEEHLASASDSDSCKTPSPSSALRTVPLPLSLSSPGSRKTDGASAVAARAPPSPAAGQDGLLGGGEGTGIIPLEQRYRALEAWLQWTD